jgi:hypothetical protein
LVIGDDQSAALGFREVPKLNDGDFGHPQLVRSEQSRVAREHIVVGTHQDRIGPTELPHGGRYLRDLLGRVRAGIGNSGDQPRNRPCFYFDIDSDIHNSTFLPLASGANCSHPKIDF